MTHPVSGNPYWKSYPNTETPVSAVALERMEAVLDRLVYPTAWASLTLANGWTHRTTGYRPSCRFVGPGQVEIVGVIEKVGGGPNGQHVLTLPSGYRPSREIVVPVMDSAGRGIGMNTKTDGTMNIYASQPTASTITVTAILTIDGPA